MKQLIIIVNEVKIQTESIFEGYLLKAKTKDTTLKGYQSASLDFI